MSPHRRRVYGRLINVEKLAARMFTSVEKATKTEERKALVEKGNPAGD